MRTTGAGSIQHILKHYLALNTEMADGAIAKLIAWEEQKANEE